MSGAELMIARMASYPPSALADDLNIRLRLEERSDSSSRPWLVVDYQHSHVIADEFPMTCRLC